ncbi:TetR/AcrR family transcriptional regulator [Pseudomonas bijieensis]|uniref:Helix-turn-helix transcriptional regulator n=1 Tax=Pseudomonas bijieensis TaxID=2681983 RepID=A0A6N1C7T4_9PSED|nr:TetR/AcrR family transcriptional regulator [Pseudomonas bijieensis]QKS81209.1 helix-turn-helix transcriptional regulator [Pseudomonas bijieensis]
MSLLLDAAAQALGSGNFANVTMDAIARAAGISKKTVYLLVASKEALLSQLVARDLSTLELLLESGIDCAEDLLSELRMYLTLWARLTLSPLALGLYLMAAQGRETAPGIARIWYQEGAERCLGLLRGWLGKAAGKGAVGKRGCRGGHRTDRRVVDFPTAQALHPWGATELVRRADRTAGRSGPRHVQSMFYPACALWRGDLSPPGCAAALKQRTQSP